MRDASYHGDNGVALECSIETPSLSRMARSGRPGWVNPHTPHPTCCYLGGRFGGGAPRC
jgi:hypothetical protein